MHWFEQLASLYSDRDIPLFHSVIYTDIEIHLNIRGELLRTKAERLPTLVPVTASSMHRTSAIDPHPLSDKLKYLAAGYSKLHHDAYLKEINNWAGSEWTSPRLCAVRDYILRGTLLSDLSHLPADENTVVRFVVDGTPLWQDSELISLHNRRMEACRGNLGFCCITGEPAPICRTHPKHIASPSSSAKLISYEHRARLVHQGRFPTAEDSFPMGQDISLKAHTVLRRIISENGVHIGSRIFAAWDSTDGLALPFSSAKRRPEGSVTVIGFTEATKGRLSVTFLRYLPTKLYETCCEKWRGLGFSVREISNAAFGHNGRNGPICSDSLYGQTAERLLGCILDGTPFPSDILHALREGAPHIYERLTEYQTGEIYEQAGLQG